jgi:NAD(P)-dependent dehydrogenase (short-subunit alcohol dehydrogenase family)
MLGGYGAAKHGLVGLSSSLRGELAPFNIKVVLIEPGAIKTPIWNRVWPLGRKSSHEVLRATSAMPSSSRREPEWESDLRHRARSLGSRPR